MKHFNQENESEIIDNNVITSTLEYSAEDPRSITTLRILRVYNPKCLLMAHININISILQAKL